MGVPLHRNVWVRLASLAALCLLLLPDWDSFSQGEASTWSFWSRSGISMLIIWLVGTNLLLERGAAQRMIFLALAWAGTWALIWTLPWLAFGAPAPAWQIVLIPAMGLGAAGAVLGWRSQPSGHRSTIG